MWEYQTLEHLLRGVEVAPPGKLTIFPGDTVRMTVGFNYRGSAISCTLRCSIGTRVLGVFNEDKYARKTLTLPQSADFVPYTAFADIATTGISIAANKDIEAKIEEYMSTTLVKIDDVIDVIGAPEFQGFAIVDYSKV